MHSFTRFLAVPAGGLLLATAAAVPAFAHSVDKGTRPAPSTTEMARMHEQMMSGEHPGMARMHEQMMSGGTDGAEPQTSTTR